MNTLKIVMLGSGLSVAGAAWAVAQDPEGDALEPASGKKSLEEQILGYWAPEWEAMADKWDPLAEGLAEMRRMGNTGEDQATAKKAVLKEMEEKFGVMTVEIKKGEVVYHMEPDHPQKMPYTIKSQDAAAGTMELLMVEEDDEPMLTKTLIKGDKLTMIQVVKEEKLPLILNRIDAAAFKLRQKEAAESEVFKDEMEAGSSRGAGEDEDASDGYPVARPIPDKPGFVFNPHNNNPVDVRGIPSGTLVRDPSSPDKLFRVP